MDRDNFMFYKSYRDAGNMIPEDKRLKFYEMIFEFGLTGEEPEDTGDPLIDMALKFIRPLIKANIRNYVNGCKGGAPYGNNNALKQPKNNQKQPKNNRETTQKQGKDKDKDTDKDNKKDKDKDKVKDKDTIKKEEPAAHFSEPEIESEEEVEIYREEDFIDPAEALRRFKEGTL